jgi:hypothetical protein
MMNYSRNKVFRDLVLYTTILTASMGVFGCQSKKPVKAEEPPKVSTAPRPPFRAEIVFVPTRLDYTLLPTEFSFTYYANGTTGCVSVSCVGSRPNTPCAQVYSQVVAAQKYNIPVMLGVKQDDYYGCPGIQSLDLILNEKPMLQ